MNSIPASLFVDVNPGVLSAGGQALDLNGVLLTYNTRTPIGSVLPFPTALEVADYYGPSSIEATLAANYFAGFDNKTQTPGNLFISQYPWLAPVSAYARGGDVASMSLTTLQGLSGGISVAIDGTTQSNSSIPLSGATSFSNAAQIIQNALGINGTVDGVVTGSISTSGVMTVGAVTSGQVSVGDEIRGTGITVETFVTGILTGTGGVGTYQVAPSPGSTVSSETITATTPAVTFDSVSGGFIIKSGTTGTGSTITAPTGSLATSLLLTAAAGVTLSQGAAIATPAAAMNAIAAVTQNWATFMPAFEPVLADKVAFAAWANSQNNRFAAIIHDTDANASVANNETCFGYLIGASGSDYSGTIAISGTAAQAAIEGKTLLSLNQSIAAMAMGSIASIDFSRTNGDASLGYKSQTGLTPNCADETSAVNLRANGYNYYGAVATANQGFEFFYPGSISGPFLSARRFVDQIYLNSQFQLALMTLQTSVPKLPYTAPGRNLIKAALNDPIQAALNFGSIEPGVVLSSLEAAELNNAAGVVISTAIQNVGYYLQVLDPGAQARVDGDTPIINFWYTDGGEVLQLSMSSVDVQ